MSGVSSSSPCPICNNEMDTYTDWKPFDYSSAECMECGFYIQPTIGQRELKEINQLRLDYNENMELKGKKRLLPLKQKDLDKYAEKIKTFW